MFSENSFIIFNFVDQFWSKLRSLQKFGGIKFHHPPPSQIESPRYNLVHKCSAI